MMRNNRWALPVILMVLALSLTVPTAAAPAGGEQQSANDRLQRAISARLIQQIRAFVAAFNRLSDSRLRVTETEYDSRFHRIFLGFEGDMAFGRGLSALLGSGERFFEGNGLVAYDLTLTRVARHSRGASCRINAEVVVFQEELIYELAGLIPGVNIAFAPAAKTLFKFLDELKVEPLAAAAAVTLREFSPEKLAALQRDAQERSSSTRDRGLAKVVGISKRAGRLGGFFLLTLAQSLPEVLGSAAGTTVGAALGSMLVPGVGTVVGGFLGSVVAGQIIEATIHKLPIELELAKVKRYGRLYDGSSGTGIVYKRYERARRALRESIKKSLASGSYLKVDVLFEALKKADARFRPALQPVVNYLRQMLTLQLEHENDRYAGRKLKQLHRLTSTW